MHTNTDSSPKQKKTKFPSTDSKVTLGFDNSCHWGVRKKRIPFKAPSNVTARSSSVIIMKYGNTAKKWIVYFVSNNNFNIRSAFKQNLPKKYEALPELLTPLEIIPNTMIHEPSKQSTSCQLGQPMKLNQEIFECVRVRHLLHLQITDSGWYVECLVQNSFAKKNTHKTKESFDIKQEIFRSSYIKYCSELLERFLADSKIDSLICWANFDCESTQLAPHSGVQCAQGNSIANDAKK